MYNYLYTIILVSIGIGIVEIISPNSSELNKYIKGIGILIIFCVILSPISNFVKTIRYSFLEDIKNSLITDSNDNTITDDYLDILQNYLNNFSISEIENKIKDILNDEFNIPNDDCKITIFTEQNENNNKLTKLQITLLGKSIFKNPYNIENYFNKLLNCECTVLIE